MPSIISPELKQYLQQLADRRLMPEMHIQYLRSLKASGFKPAVIYDIGSGVLHWTREAKTLWPEAQVFLFDAFAPAEFLYQGYQYHVGVLSDQDEKEVRFYQNDFLPGGNSYYKEVGSQDASTVFPADKYILCKTSMLDTIVVRRHFPMPDLIKMDVQGAEKDIICGGMQTLAHATHLIVELQHEQYNEGAPRVDVTRPFIESLGWTCVAPLFCNNGPDGDYGFVKSEAKSAIAALNDQLKQAQAVNTQPARRPARPLPPATGPPVPAPPRDRTSIWASLDQHRKPGGRPLPTTSVMFRQVPPRRR